MPFDKSTYDKEYAKQHVKRIHIPFNDKNPDDVILREWLKTKSNVTQYIKGLIMTDYMNDSLSNR